MAPRTTLCNVIETAGTDVDYYHTERPHQAKGNLPLTGEWPVPSAEMPTTEEIVCRQRLGGLLKHYERRAG